jgi:hypothetical protein
MTSAELDRLSTEVAALAAEQEQHLRCPANREFPEDLARNWHPSHGSGTDASFDSAEQIGPKHLWRHLLTWALCAISLGTALTWKSADPNAAPPRSLEGTESGGPVQ